MTADLITLGSFVLLLATLFEIGYWITPQGLSHRGQDLADTLYPLSSDAFSR